MAVKPTPNNSLYKGFTFDGIDSRDYGVYISGDAVFDSPERDVEMIEIPGRNGSFALDKGRFGNITVSYPAGIFGEDEASFREGIRALRNALASRKGYCRLEDDYNPNEYRMAVYKKGLEVDPALLKAGEFTIEFDCMPQRWLKSGETAVIIGGEVTNTKTESGSIVSIESDGGDAVTSLVAQIEPVQSGSGDPSPTNVRPITEWTAANVFVTNSNYLSLTQNTVKANILSNVTISDISDNEVTLVSKGVATYNRLSRFIFLKNGAYAFKFQAESSDAYTPVITIYNSEGRAIANNVQPNTLRTFTVNADQIVELRMFATTNPTVAGRVVRFYDVMLTQGTTINEFIPFKGKTYHVSFGSAGTVYGGTVDVVTGVLTVTHAFSEFNGSENWELAETTSTATTFRVYPSSGQFKSLTNGGNGISNWAIYGRNPSESNIVFRSSIYSNGTMLYFLVPKSMDIADTVDAWKSYLSTHHLQATQELVTPQTYQLTAQQVELLTGNNNVWADTGDIALTYGDDPYKVVNPTLFESHPLLQVWGYGGLAINGEPLRINSTAIGDVNISGNYRSEIVENSVSAPISLDVLNNNDLFYFERPTVTVYLVGDFVPSTNEALTIVSNGLVVLERGYGNAVGERCIYAALATRNGYIGRFKGITDTSTHQTSITIGGSVVATFNVVESYNADGSTWGWSVTGLPSDANGYVAMYYARLWGKSTKSALGEPLYFDLDIGEAYKIEDEQIISVNNAVTIPAKLPALKSGNNTITYDRTITQFKIVPRWWEV